MLPMIRPLSIKVMYLGIASAVPAVHLRSSYQPITCPGEEAYVSFDFSTVPEWSAST